MVVVHTLRGVADGSIAPVVGASQLWSIFVRASPAIDLGVFAGLREEWEEHPAERAEIEIDIRATAARMLKAIDRQAR